jgi:shikimate dehydrogenase
MKEQHIFGLIGKSLAHSFSKDFFTQKFKTEAIPANYRYFELDEIAKIETVFALTNLSGLNVTIPYKEKVIPFLDELSEEASRIQAVNTIAFENGKKVGYNTDIYGFKQSIKPFLRNIHERALILGTGGASKAVADVLQGLGISVIFLSRNPKTESTFSYTECNEWMVKACKLIVNCTPLGTFPNIEQHPPIPMNWFTDEHLVIDLIYNPEKTLLLQQAEKSGADILNGRSMLQHQALKSWEIWNK